MALLTPKTTSAKATETATVTIMSIIPLRDEQCPTNKETGEVLKKVLLKLSNGDIIGALDGQIKNKPLAFGKDGVEANIAYRNVEVEKDGKKVQYSQVVSVEFDSMLRELSQISKAPLAVAGMR